MKFKSIKLFLTSFFFLTAPFFAQSSEGIDFPSNKSDKRYDPARVEKIISADTIVLEGGEKVKLIGLKAPSPPRRKKAEQDEHGIIIEPEDPITPIEEEAFDFVQSLLKDKFIRLEFDEQKKTANFETLAYVYVDNTLVNAEILRQGFAFLQIAAPNLKYADMLRAAYREARSEKRGLHNE